MNIFGWIIIGIEVIQLLIHFIWNGKTATYYFNFPLASFLFLITIWLFYLAGLFS